MSEQSQLYYTYFLLIYLFWRTMRVRTSCLVFTEINFKIYIFVIYRYLIFSAAVIFDTDNIIHGIYRHRSAPF